MSEAHDISAHTIGPGRLILVVGPSGAGKDTLLDMAKAACSEDRNIVFPRRVVTREASAAEDNEALSAEIFREALARGEFALHWEAHGHIYGLRSALDDDIRAGRTVVINVSRTVIDPARRSYAEVTVVSITAPPEVLAERIAMRARGSDALSGQRLGRTVVETSMPDVTILNVGRPEDHARRLVRIIRGDCASM
ncbi:MAG TPA: phosphonate metabolism protein/1,5-bisphosphokinase (PRPP-forming) PhnN [Bradyrhizobium sp.]|jgi:ribose 1,5-bisphosphokinase